MRTLFMLVSLAGCHELFALDDVSVPGRDPDAPIDPECPPIGAAPPTFQADLKPVFQGNCADYTTSKTAGLAVAVCAQTTERVLMEGPIGGVMSPSLIEFVPSKAVILEAWIAADGNMLVTHQSEGQTPTTHRISIYDRAGERWVYRNEVATGTSFMSAGVPSGEAEPRLVVSQADASGAFIRELVERDGVWSEVRQVPWADFVPAVSLGDSTHLSPDGLRLTFQASQFAYYSDRASVGESFRSPVRIAGLTQVIDPFLTADCERVYTVGVGAVFFRYLQQ